MAPKQIVLFSFATALLIFLSYNVRNALLIIHMSVVFAVVLNPAVDKIQQLSIAGWHPGRGAAILLIVMVIAVLVLFFLILGLPPLIGDLRELAEQLPKKLEQLRARIKSFPFLGGTDFGGALEQYGGALLRGVAGLASGIVKAVAEGTTTAILSAYLMLEGREILSWAMSLFPERIAIRLRSTLLRAGEQMRKWLIGQLILVVILGSASAVSFGLLRIRYFYLLAVFAGVANIFPLLGPIATVILAGLVAAIDSIWKVVGVLVFYAVYQQVENAFLTPMIMKSQLHLPATTVVISVLIGAQLAGVAGALVAVPTAALASVLIDEYLVRNRP